VPWYFSAIAVPSPLDGGMVSVEAPARISIKGQATSGFDTGALATPCGAVADLPVKKLVILSLNDGELGTCGEAAVAGADEGGADGGGATDVVAAGAGAAGAAGADDPPKPPEEHPAANSASKSRAATGAR
jgi:hypothetical protein